MENEVEATLALDGLPLGSMVAAAYIDENDDTATVILFEHREHEGQRQWWDLTRRQAWWSASDIVRAFDDMVVTARPDEDAAPVGITGRLRFRYSDGSWIEWSTKERQSAAHIHEVVTSFAALDRTATGAQAAEAQA